MQGANESSSAFIARYARLMVLSDQAASQSKMIAAIRIKLKPEILERLPSHSVHTVEDLNLACSAIEDNLRASRMGERFRQNRATPDDSRRALRPRTSMVKKEKFARSKTGNQQPSSSEAKCLRCNRPGHRRAACFATKEADGSPLTDNAPARPPVKTAAVVDDNSGSDSDSPTVVVRRNPTCSTVIANCGQQTLRKNLVFYPVQINGVSLNAQIDTGSEKSIMCSEIASINAWVPKGPAPDLTTADNCKMRCHGRVKIDLTIAIGSVTEEAKDANIIVADSLCQDLIIGMDLLKPLRVLVDAEDKTIVFKGENLAPEIEVIPLRAEKVIWKEGPPRLVGAVQTIPFTTGDPSLIVANSIDTIKNGTVRCLIINLDTEPKHINRRMEIATFEPLETSANGKTFQVNAAMQVVDTNEFVNVGEDLNDEQVNELKQLLNEYKSAFSIDGSLGCTNLVEHDIELEENAKPFNEPLRRRPFAHKDETRRQVKKMLEMGIIEESKSPWASAYVLAAKKNGEMRLGVDFRRLNDSTKKWVYPLPNIDDCAETLAGKQYFSQLDMASGFWQLPLSKRARELTAFRVEDGHYQFTRMPFGLTNAPARFQRLTNVLFSGLKGLHLQVFIDDICVATSTWAEHLSMLAKVFSLLIKANLQLKSNKCVFGVKEVVFLGHLISADGIKQDPKKLEALSRLPVPKNVKQLRTVLGLMNYYRKFVPNYAIRAAPMTRLLKTN